MNISTIVKERLLKEAEKDYKKFSAALIPNINNILGIRIPILRNIAKEIYQEYGKEYLKVTETEFIEEIMLQGFIIGILKEEPENILKHIEEFVPKIDNWATCDTFCSSLKFTKKNQQIVWDFLQNYLTSEKEYEIRFGLVMLLGHFVTDAYIDRILLIIDSFKHEEYYAKMAAAWLISVCYVKFPQKTHEYLKVSKLDNWTYNKGIQKTCESFRVNKNTKIILKTFKRAGVTPARDILERPR